MELRTWVRRVVHTLLGGWRRRERNVDHLFAVIGDREGGEEPWVVEEEA